MESVEKALNNGLELLDLLKDIVIEDSKVHTTLPAFSSRESIINCFVGHAPKNGDEIPILACSQTYYLPISTKNESIFLSRSLGHFYSKEEQRGFEFLIKQCKNNKGELSEIKINEADSISSLLEKNEWINLNINILSFYKKLNAPNFFKKNMSKKHPMSASVVMSKKLNKSLSKIESGTEHFCYSFVDDNSGPAFVGFGPGKFKKAIKHYSVSTYDNKLCKVCLTAAISPRSEQVLNVKGIDPVYSSFKMMDFLTFNKWKVYDKNRTAAELFMMKHHAAVHEDMLEVFFANACRK